MANLSNETRIELLGMPTYHGLSMLTNPTECEMWIAALDAKFNNPLQAIAPAPGSRYQRAPAPFTRKDWDSLLGHVSAVTEIPSVCFGPELIDAYPKAKVALMYRDVDAWFKSYDNSVIQSTFHPLSVALGNIDPAFGDMLVGIVYRIFVGYFGAKKATKEEVRRVAKEGYERHYELIRRITPKERLLEYKLGTGWGPLCEFLGADEPVGVEFPRVNEMAAYHDLMLAIFIGSLWRIAKAYGWIVIITLAIVASLWLF
jgi:hypothetical protein